MSSGSSNNSSKNKAGLKDGTLRTLDLFSGVGGLTLAMHGYATPVAYCDVALEARQSLHHNMRKGLLPAAPICNNVQLLNKAWINATCEIKTVDMIVGGFPCVGFSPMGRQQGFEEKQSSLFHEILRLADELEVPMLFLENVPAVLNLGMHTITEELCTKRGYELRWCVVPAELVGAAHKRARWYALAVKPGFKHRWLADASYELHSWDVSAMPVTAIPRANAGTKAACGMMGNSVVPAGVRYAFLYLLGRCGEREVPRDLSTSAGLTLLPTGGAGEETGQRRRRRRAPAPAEPTEDAEQGGAGSSVSSRQPRWPSCGICPAGTHNADDVLAMAAPGELVAPPQQVLTFDPAAYQSDAPPSAQCTTAVLTQPVTATKWATPRHGNTAACNYLTERSIRDLPSQVRFCTLTPPELRGGGISPMFVEWLMGYPAGWVSEQAMAYVPVQRSAAAPRTRAAARAADAANEDAAADVADAAADPDAVVDTAASNDEVVATEAEVADVTAQASVNQRESQSARTTRQRSGSSRSKPAGSGSRRRRVAIDDIPVAAVAVADADTDAGAVSGDVSHDAVPSDVSHDADVANTSVDAAVETNDDTAPENEPKDEFEVEVEAGQA